MKKIAVATFTILALALLPASSASAAEAVAGPGGFAAGFITRAVVVAAGEGITFTNLDAPQHNFIADGVFLAKKAAKKAEWCTAYPKGKCPLFWSPSIGTGESTEVQGLESLKSGEQYPFYCSIHPGMKGTIVVR